jgi:hypothetical protein
MTRGVEGPAGPTDINVSFVVRRNLLFLPTMEIGGKRGRYFFGTAQPRSVIDRKFAASIAPAQPPYRIVLREQTTATLSPIIEDLRPAGDVLVGIDALGQNAAVTIDYAKQLLTIQPDRIYPAYMTLYNFEGAPQINVTVDGTVIRAVVDTTNPDTLVLPRGGSHGRARHDAHVIVAGSDLGMIDVREGDVSEARIGNRLLSKFLVSIDYKSHRVGLWRDPRTR